MSATTPPLATPVHLLGPIAAAVDGAFDRGLPMAIAYVDGTGRPHLSLRGTLQVLSDDVRNRVFDASPEREQAHDPDRKGTAVVIDVDSVRGRGPDGMVVMARDPG